MTDIDEITLTREEIRLQECRRNSANWRRWGPYLSERQWGTVREDYSCSGCAWEDFSHDVARSRAYRWGEDGIGGICDRYQLVCFALALWNGRDPILKERLFGLTGNEGNHGEDVKELYYYLDSTPTHSYMKFLYKYPQAEFPYRDLVDENRRRGRERPEYELLDTGIFDENRYFDVFVEYAKASPDDIAIRITAHNRGPEAAPLHLLPTLWFRNTWSWGRDPRRPTLCEPRAPRGTSVIEAEHAHYGKRWLLCNGAPELLFTENETNMARLFGQPNRTPYVKDGIGEHVVGARPDTVNLARTGTKAAAWYRVTVPGGGSETLRLRLTDQPPSDDLFGEQFDEIFAARAAEADEFYARRAGRCTSPDALAVQRQAFAGLLLSKQLYYYDVRSWLEGDPAYPPPPPERCRGRNSDWKHLYNADVISMPDKWEYPWYAAWDLAFHCIPLALVDPDFAKAQLVLLLRERYIQPTGQIPAYEWNFSDVNPPVFAWAALRVYKIERRVRGRADRDFLQRVFHKLLLNFTWWVNRKDSEGDNVFEGGFLGLDNVSLFDRSQAFPGGGHLEQSDGTSWMGMYCLNMLAIALELSRQDSAYDDVATKFLEHFVQIAHAMDDRGSQGFSLWDEDDGFYYDVIHLPNGEYRTLKVRSIVGMIPLFATEILEPEVLDSVPFFKRRLAFLLQRHPELRSHIVETQRSARGVRWLLSLVSPARLPRVLRRLLDEAEFLSPYGIRSLSRAHRDQPVVLKVAGNEYCLEYQPAESTTGMFGGNSNWRGPIWFPVNFLLIESLQKLHHYLGDGVVVECPTGSGQWLTLWNVAAELSRRLIGLFLPRSHGSGRPFQGGNGKMHQDPNFRDHILFHEYFHGDTGEGLGASHQTGWTALVAKLIEQTGG